MYAKIIKIHKTKAIFEAVEQKIMTTHYTVLDDCGLNDGSGEFFFVI